MVVTRVTSEKQAGIAIIGKMGGINAKVMAVYSSQITSRLSEVLTTAGNRTEDIYNILRKDSALTGVLSGYESITQAEKRLLENAADGDVIGFVDKAGRQWSMERYTEMLTRTATMEMHNEAKRTEFLAHGEDLVIVSSHGGSCPMCSPYDGKVLSLTGATEGYETIDEAEAQGLFHPNCKHTYSLYIDENPAEGIIETAEYKQEQHDIVSEIYTKEKWTKEKVTGCANLYTAQSRIRQSKNELKILQSDKELSTVLMKQTGRDVHLLPEYSGERNVKHPDIWFSGAPMEMKRVKGNINKVASNALKASKQADNVFLYVEKNYGINICLKEIHNDLKQRVSAAKSNGIVYTLPKQNALLYIYTNGRLYQKTWKSVLP